MATDKQSAEKEITVEEKLSTLYQLQTMMTEIDKIKTLRGELPLEVQDLEDEIAGLETRLQNYQSEIKDFENAVVEQKHKITESTGLIEKYKAQDWKAVRLIWFKSRVNWNRSFPKPSRTKRNCAKKQRNWRRISNRAS